ncbi:MAG: ProQ/FinO family protein [Betaproteobacteria bacterium]|nr:ProQ/FinO family protein [Betaproteobacteria bacterium]
MQKKFKYNEVLSELINRFPFCFSQNPRQVVPLGTNTLSEISRVLGIEGEQLEPYRLALKDYKRSSAYLTALALGKKRRTLWGEKFPAHITPLDREQARSELQRRGVWSETLEHIYRSKIGHFVQLEKNSPSSRTHRERFRRWIERLQAAGFTEDDIRRIQSEGIQTDDLEETRRLLDSI